MTTATLTPHWSTFEKIGFRFSFIYFSLFIMIQNNGAYPLWGALMKLPNRLLEKFIPWVGAQVLKLPYSVSTVPSGSGDTTYDYIIVLVIFSIAFLGTLIWSIVDKNRNNYTKLYYWLTVAMRFYVGLMLINYGLIKVVKLQFPEPAFYRLIEPYGKSSPMGLAWTFLGFSKGYNLFMGLAEIAAVLILFRRTLTFGLIITLMTTANVMAVNYFYDVPVKLLSTHLVLMTIFLLARDIKNICTFFFTSTSVSLTVMEQPKKEGDKSVKMGSLIIKGLVLAYVAIFGFINLSESQKLYGTKAPKPAVFGLFETTYFEKNGEKLPANLNDSERWRYLIMERKESATVYKMDGTRIGYKTKIDTLKKEINFSDFNDSTDMFILKYKKTKLVFSFETVIKGDSIKAHCSVLTKEDFLLMNRGFHWISEQPYNR